jgi:hypothetical protein
MSRMELLVRMEGLAKCAAANAALAGGPFPVAHPMKLKVELNGIVVTVEGLVSDGTEQSGLPDHPQRVGDLRSRQAAGPTSRVATGPAGDIQSLDVLRLFACGTKPTVRDVSAQLGTNKYQAHQALKSCANAGLLSQEALTGSYTLTGKGTKLLASETHEVDAVRVAPRYQSRPSNMSGSTR